MGTGDPCISSVLPPTFSETWAPTPACAHAWTASGSLSTISTSPIPKQRAALERRLQRVKELCEWGHKSKEEYWADYNTIQIQLQSLAPAKDRGKSLERLALFLRDVSLAWKQSDEQQRNRLARQLFDIVWIKE